MKLQPAPLDCTRRHRFSRAAKHATGTPYMGLKEREAADKIVGNAIAGTTGSPVMRLLLSSRGEREGPDGCFVARMGGASPGPARHSTNVSSICSTGCPVFAAPTALDPADWERQMMTSSPEQKQPQIPPSLPAGSSERPEMITEQPRTSALLKNNSQHFEIGTQAQQQQHGRLMRSLAARPKTSQVRRRWPLHTHVRDEGRISGNLGQDSPGPGTLNIANHDPFRAKSFLKTDVCQPPPASSLASYPFCVPFR